MRRKRKLVEESDNLPFFSFFFLRDSIKWNLKKNSEMKNMIEETELKSSESLISDMNYIRCFNLKKVRILCDIDGTICKNLFYLRENLKGTPLNQNERLQCMWKSEVYPLARIVLQFLNEGGTSIDFYTMRNNDPQTKLLTTIMLKMNSIPFETIEFSPLGEALDSIDPLEKATYKLSLIRKGYTLVIDDEQTIVSVCNILGQDIYQIINESSWYNVIKALIDIYENDEEA